MEPKWLLTKRKIEALVSQYELTDPVLRAIFTQNNTRSPKAFISHSSNDKDFVKKVLAFLFFSKGIQGYVDWQDPSMPSVTNADTAKILKKRIENAPKLIFIVTYESLKSVWCSWELGYADKANGAESIAVLAIKPNNGKWKKNEYLQQYPWISYDETDRLFKVHLLNNNTMTLFEWLDA